MDFSSWHWFLFLTGACIVLQGFFAMLEMAAVSFNKVRLQYYVSREKSQAIWLSYLLHHPALLFGTTLVMVNTSLLVGSESARRFYDAVGLSPDWAPLSQVFLVLIFAEIAPMFAGRRYAEHAAMIGVPILYFFSMVLKPFIYLLDLLCKWINRLFGTYVESGVYLTREELQNMIEEREETAADSKQDPFGAVVSRIFLLKNKTAKELMIPLDGVKMIPTSLSIGDLREILRVNYSPYVPLYHRTEQNIVAIAYPRDLLRLPDHKKVREAARSAWFITENNSIIEILKQFRRNNQSIAVVLNESGLAMGILTLDEIIDEIFCRSDHWMSFGEMLPRAFHIVLDRTFSGDTTLEELNTKYQVHLSFEQAETLEEVLSLSLGHPPSKGESIRIDQFELTVEEAPLIGEKMISVKTVY